MNPKIRNKKEIDVINNINIQVTTNKNLPINIKSFKTKNLLTSLTLIVYYNNQTIARVGFHIDLNNMMLRIGGAEVQKEFRRQGIYTELINIIKRIADDYNLTIFDRGRSDDAKNFWQNIS